jgi:hypothetical protein
LECSVSAGLGFLDHVLLHAIEQQRHQRVFEKRWPASELRTQDFPDFYTRVRVMLVGVNCKSWVDKRGNSQHHAFRIECRAKESPELVHAELTQFIQKPILLSPE